MATKSKTVRTPHKKAARGSPRKDWKRTFLATLAETANVAASARVAGIARSTAYTHKLDDPDFASEWDDVFEGAIDEAESELYRRAVHGVERAVYQNGKRVGTIKEYSDTCLIFLLKGRRGEVYGQKSKHELSGPHGGPLPISIEQAIDDIYGGNPDESEPALSEGDELKHW